MTATAKANTINNIIGAMSGISDSKKDEIINRQLCHCFRADSQLRIDLAKGLAVKVGSKLLS